MAPDVEHDYEDPAGFLADADDVLQSCLDTFGVRAYYRRAGAEAELIPSGVIFRETHEEIDILTGVAVTSQKPTADCRRTEIPDADDLDDGDRLIVAGRTFRIDDIEKDGEVGAKMLLTQVTS